MRSVIVALAIGVSFSAVSAAQTYRVRAPAYERLVLERLRIGGMEPAQTRALVFPCKPVGRGCASNPLDANQLRFEGPAAAWDGFEVCRRADSGDVCVPLDRVFGAPPR